MGTETGAGTGRERAEGLGCRPVDEHRMGTGTGARTKMRAVAEMESGTRMGTGTETGMRTGSGRAEERQRSARNRTRVVDDHALSFRTHHHLCGQEVALAGTRQLR